MCGINGIFDPLGQLVNKRVLLQSMGDQMAYRGPDGQGAFVNETVALGMRRLSIIDVEGGGQPLYNEDCSLVLVLNGEIYNYVELMRDLKGRGHQFKTGSDAETILHLYEEKGERCLEDLRGMFAFVLWDTARKRLFAARDRVGIKPLYIAEQANVLWLSSELKAIVRAARFAPNIDPRAVYQFLLYSHAVDQRNTVVSQVQRVLPGEYLLADKRGITLRSYWTPRFSGDAGVKDHTDEEILNTFESAVGLHLRSDVPVGILLSGGVDSSAIAAVAASSGGNYTALCAGYEGEHDVDERGQAHATAKFLNMAYTDVVIDPAGYAADFDELLKYSDEPVGDPAAMPQWSLYRQASRRGYKVLLSGIGGDEVFFGYPAWNQIGEQSRSLSPENLSRWTGFNQSKFFLGVRYLLDTISNPDFREAAASADQPLYALRDLAPRGPDAMTSILFGCYLVHNGCYLGDKLGMGCSVEVRVPFLDHRLVQTIFELPLARRFDVTTSKVMLKRLLRGRVPDTVLDAPKRGFVPPPDYLDHLAGQHCDEILHGELVGWGWVQRSALESLCAKHNALPWLRRNRVRKLIGVEKSGWFLFRLLSFERWYKILFGKRESV